MDSLPVGSVQSWLAVVVATLSPLIALIVGFEGGRLVAPAAAAGRTGAHALLEGAEGKGD